LQPEAGTSTRYILTIPVLLFSEHVISIIHAVHRVENQALQSGYDEFAITSTFDKVRGGDGA
jgi:hypothetical protein